MKLSVVFPPHLKKRVFWIGLVFIFLLALLPRLIHPAVSRPMQWYERSVRFWDALLTGDLEGTYQIYHPGVTTMWIAGLGLRSYAAIYGWTGVELLDPPVTPEGVKYYPIGSGVMALSLVIAVCIVLAYILLVQLTSWPVAFVGGCLLALDPFYVAYSKVLHVDALLASFMLVSMLFLICYLYQNEWSHLAFSGVFAGLAFLTKSPSGLLFPYTILATIAFSFSHSWTCADHTLSNLGRKAQAHQKLWGAVRVLGVWGGIASLTFILLWPAMWRTPLNVLSKVVQEALFRVETPHKNANFFATQVVYGDPGWLYYLATVAWKTTFVTLPAICATVYFLLWQRRWREDNKPTLWILVYAGSFFLMMMLAAKKGLRYLLPIFPALDVAAASGLVQTATGIGRQVRLRKTAWIPTAVVSVALTAQIITTLRHHPYYGTHHNLLMGGSRVAQYILPLGDEGEGLYLAARFLNDYPGAERRSAGLQQRSFRQFQRYFKGETRDIWEPGLDYWVFTINVNQRELNTDHWDDRWEICQQTRPLHTIFFDGVPYVWVCRAYPHTPESFDIEHQTDVLLGNHISLLGYKLSSKEISPTVPLTVTLFWQSDGRLVEDYHVFVHLLDSAGQLVAQHDSAPMQGEWPTWEWRDTEVIADKHRIVTNATLPAGTYTLSVGMYDSMTKIRLPVIAPASGRLLDDQFILPSQITR